MKVNGRQFDEASVDLELHRKVVAIFADIFQIEIDAYTADIRREEIESWDSVNHLRLVAEIEEVFETELSDKEVVAIMSLGAVERLLIGRRDGASPA